MSTARSSQLWLMQGKVLSPMCGKEHKFQALLGFRVGWMIGFWKVFWLALHCSTASYWQTTSCLLSDIETLNTIITKPSVRIKFVSWGQIFVAHKSLHVYLFCWSIENLRSSGGNDQPNEKSKSWLTKWLSSILISLKGWDKLRTCLGGKGMHLWHISHAPMKDCALRTVHASLAESWTISAINFCSWAASL